MRAAQERTFCSANNDKYISFKSRDLKPVFLYSNYLKLPQASLINNFFLVFDVSLFIFQDHRSIRILA